MTFNFDLDCLPGCGPACRVAPLDLESVVVFTGSLGIRPFLGSWEFKSIFRVFGRGWFSDGSQGLVGSRLFVGLGLWPSQVLSVSGRARVSMFSDTHNEKYI